ncbi:MAG: hypothetical protein OEY32_04960, partial [Candidatus Krumholzibacteria bacterium]|nr:hypothetical protein [Candidatus Krumholzibacteria bacterium]
MRSSHVIAIVALALTVTFGCSREKPVMPEQAGSDNLAVTANDAELLASAIVARSGWELDPEALTPKISQQGVDALEHQIMNYSRQPLTGDIAHYYFEVRVGPGLYDVIGLHRVVKETSPNRPIRSKKSIFLQHGDAVGFVKFLFGVASPNTPDEQSAAIFFAENGVDVWGIDQDWILVPESETDFSFMADWGLQHNVDNLNIGMTVAREARLLTGNGFRKMNLLGYSSGLWTTFALVNQETQLPPGHRNISGFIPVDGFYKTNIEESRVRSCDDVAYYTDVLNAGGYADNGGVLFRTIGFLAQTDPDGDSPIVPGMTNLETALAFGGATYWFFAYVPWYHFVAGVFEEGAPVALQYTTLNGWFDFIQSAASYEPNRFILDYSRITCDEEDVPFDDHLSEVDVPILYVGAAGGFGEAGVYATTLTGSNDVTIHNVQLHPANEPTRDFGHIDLWSADNAQTEVWVPILNWIDDHAPG